MLQAGSARPPRATRRSSKCTPIMARLDVCWVSLRCSATTALRGICWNALSASTLSTLRHTARLEPSTKSKESSTAHPESAAENATQPSAQSDPLPWEYPAVAFGRRLWECRRDVPAGESSCPMPCDSRACRDSLRDSLQTRQSTDHRRQLLPDWLLRVCTRPKHRVWRSKTALHHP